MKKLLIFAVLASVMRLAIGADQTWPSKPINLIVPFSAGSLTDIIARAYGKELSQRLDTPVIIVNKAGAAGQIGTQALLNAPADGYTLMIQGSNFAIMPSMQKNLPFNIQRDFAGVALVQTAPTLAIVGASSPYKTFSDLVDSAKAKPGKLSFGSAGVGSAAHLTAEYYLMAAGITMNHIPYKGAQEPFVDIEGGRLDATFPPVSLALSLIKGGKLRALAISSEQRSSLLPDVPTMAELGYKGFRWDLWYAFVAKAGTPKPILEKLAAELKTISDAPSISKQMTSQGLVKTYIALQDLDKYLTSQVQIYAQIVKKAGLTQ